MCDVLCCVCDCCCNLRWCCCALLCRLVVRPQWWYAYTSWCMHIPFSCFFVQWSSCCPPMVISGACKFGGVMVWYAQWWCVGCSLLADWVVICWWCFPTVIFSMLMVGTPNGDMQGCNIARFYGDVVLLWVVRCYVIAYCWYWSFVFHLVWLWCWGSVWSCMDVPAMVILGA